MELNQDELLRVSQFVEKGASPLLEKDTDAKATVSALHVAELEGMRSLSGVGCNITTEAMRQYGADEFSEFLSGMVWEIGSSHFNDLNPQVEDFLERNLTHGFLGWVVAYWDQADGLLDLTNGREWMPTIVCSLVNKTFIYQRYSGPIHVGHWSKVTPRIPHPESENLRVDELLQLLTIFSAFNLQKRGIV